MLTRRQALALILASPALRVTPFVLAPLAPCLPPALTRAVVNATGTTITIHYYEVLDLPNVTSHEVFIDTRGHC